jgi:anion-transporting  ArsA/GET3 family ATPase
MITTATPGIKDVLVLGKIKQLERQGPADVILVDAPAAGHAISFLRSASGLKDAVSVGPIDTQARDVIEMLTDETRCRVVLVTLGEETPVNEAVETAFSLEDQVGVKLGPIVVNGVYPRRDLPKDVAGAARRAEVTLAKAERDRLGAAADFRRGRYESQQGQIARLAEALPLPQITLPFVFRADLDTGSIHALAEEFVSQVELLDEPVASP